jgi:hypothetical protein
MPLDCEVEREKMLKQADEDPFGINEDEGDDE